MANKIKVGIFFGGSSREREVSFAGGRTVYDNLNKSLFEAIPLFVDSFGNIVELYWEYVYKGSIRDFYPPTHYNLDGQRQQCLPDMPNGFQIYAESLTPTKQQQIAMLETLGTPRKLEELKDLIDVAFLALHGLHGEDGSIQGALEWLGIPYTGSGIFPSALGMNKALQKGLQTQAGLYVNPFFTLKKSDWMRADAAQKQQWLNQAHQKLGNKFVVKPANQGSSLGVSILESPDNNTFEQAVELGFFKLKFAKSEWQKMATEEQIQWIKQLCDIRSGLGLPLQLNGKIMHLPTQLMEELNTQFQSQESVLMEAEDGEIEVILEQFIAGKEFSCIVIADEQQQPFALPPTEIRKSGAMFDYRSKYLPGLSNKVTPIEIPDAWIQKVREACCELYAYFGFEVYARIDGFITDQGDVFLNDPNTTSGMMPSSFFFHQAAEIGLNPSQFLTLVLKNSLQARVENHTRGHHFLPLIAQLNENLRNSGNSGNNKKRIAVIMGGYSFERHISMESGRNIYEKLSSSESHQPIPVFLLGDAHQYQLVEIPINMMLKDNADDIRDKILHYKANPSLVKIQQEARKISATYNPQEIVYEPQYLSLEALANKCEGVFIALHGRPGEDGTLQKDLAKVGLYHNGSLAHSSEITINKYETNKKLRELGFLVANHELVKKMDWLQQGMALAERICKEFGLPLIAKPADDGCSAAVRKIKSAEEMNQFMAAIFRDSAEVPKSLAESLHILPGDEMPQKQELLIEQFIDHAGAVRFLEVTGGMVTHVNANGEIEYEVFEPSESLAESEILSLEEKFLAGQGQNITPARYAKDIEEQNRISQEVRKTLEKVARALDVTGYCRIDAFVRIMANGQVDTIIIEINSLPGMTPATCIYHQAAINGYKPFEFIAEILKFGKERKS